jgi:hypothetical protein
VWPARGRRRRGLRVVECEEGRRRRPWICLCPPLLFPFGAYGVVSCERVDAGGSSEASRLVSRAPSVRPSVCRGRQADSCRAMCRGREVGVVTMEVDGWIVPVVVGGGSCVALVVSGWCSGLHLTAAQWLRPGASHPPEPSSVASLFPRAPPSSGDVAVRGLAENRVDRVIVYVSFFFRLSRKSNLCLQPAILSQQCGNAV